MSFTALWTAELDVNRQKMTSLLMEADWSSYLIKSR
jgi:hypothetical protein